MRYDFASRYLRVQRERNCQAWTAQGLSAIIEASSKHQRDGFADLSGVVGRPGRRPARDRCRLHGASLLRSIKYVVSA